MKLVASVSGVVLARRVIAAASAGASVLALGRNRTVSGCDGATGPAAAVRLAGAGAPMGARGGTAEEADGTAGTPARTGAGGGASGAEDTGGGTTRADGGSRAGSAGEAGAAEGTMEAGTAGGVRFAATPAGGVAGAGVGATERGAGGWRIAVWGTTGTGFGAGSGAGRDGRPSSACRSTVTWARAGGGASNQAARAAGSRRITRRP